MKIKATIIVEDPDKCLFDALKPDLTDSRSDRSCVDIEKKSDKVILNIQANDTVALRAALNSLAKLFMVYEKMKRV